MTPNQNVGKKNIFEYNPNEATVKTTAPPLPQEHKRDGTIMDPHSHQVDWDNPTQTLRACDFLRDFQPRTRAIDHTYREFSEYVKFVLHHVASPQLSLSLPLSAQLNLMHVLCGIASEAVELVKLPFNNVVVLTNEEMARNLVEELGDFWFYRTWLMDQMGEAALLPVQDSLGYEPIAEKPMDQMAAHVADLALDVMKRHFFYGKPQHFGTLFGQCDALMVGYCRYFGLDLYAVQAANVEKLQKRYHEGKFSTEQAIDRADKR